MVCVIIDTDVVKVFNYMAAAIQCQSNMNELHRSMFLQECIEEGPHKYRYQQKVNRNMPGCRKIAQKTFTLKLQPIQRRSCRWQFDWRRCAGKLNFCSGFTRTMFRTNTTIQYNGFMRTLFRRNTTIAQVFTRAIYSVYKDYGNTNSVNLF